MSHLFDHREVMAAAPDAIAMALGLTPTRPHPIAGLLGLRDISYSASVLSNRIPGRGIGASGMAMNYGAVEFSRALADGVQQLIVNTFNGQQQHRQFCASIEVKDFKEAELPGLDADIALELLAENAEITQGFAIVSAGASKARLSTFAKIIGLSRTAIVNDQLDGFARVIAGLGASAARLEARLVAEAFESNPVLDDGSTVFDLVGNTHNNVVAQALTGPTLGDAMTKLRTQVTASGNLADLAAKHLVVSAELEYPSRVILGQLNLDIELSVLSYLPTGRWYLLADPMVHPSIGTLKLKGAKTPVQVVEQKRRPDSIDGVAVKVVADLGAVLVSRSGLVRGGV